MAVGKGVQKVAFYSLEENFKPGQKLKIYVQKNFKKILYMFCFEIIYI